MCCIIMLYTYTYTFSLNVMIIGQLDASCWPFHLRLAAGTWQTLNLHINTDPHRITVCTDGMLLLFLKIRVKEVSWIILKLMHLKRAFNQTANNDLLLLFLSQLFVCFFYNASHSAPHAVCSQSQSGLFRDTYNPSCFPLSLQYQMGDCGVSH